MFGGGGNLTSGLSQTVSLAMQMRALRNQENEALQQDAQYISQRANSLTPTQLPFFLDEVGLAEQRWGSRWPKHLAQTSWNATPSIPASAAGAVNATRPSPGYGSFAAEEADLNSSQSVNLARTGGAYAEQSLNEVANMVRGQRDVQQQQGPPKPFYQDTSGMGFLANPEGIVMAPNAPKEIQNTWGKWESQIRQAAKEAGIDPRLLAAVVARESGGDPNARSEAGALGLAQLMPATAESLGVTDPADPMQNLRGGAMYLKQLSDKYQGDLPRTLAAYNFGMGNVDSGKAYPMETRKYVQDVSSWYAGFDLDGVGKEATGHLEAVSGADTSTSGDPLLVASQRWTQAIREYGTQGAIEVMKPAFGYLDQSFQQRLASAKSAVDRGKVVDDQVKLGEQLLKDAFFGEAGMNLEDPEGMLAALFPQDRAIFRRMQAEMLKNIGAMDNSGVEISGAKAFLMAVDEFGGPSGMYDMNNAKSMEVFSSIARPWMVSVGEQLAKQPDRSDWVMRVDSYDNKLFMANKPDPGIVYEINEWDAFRTGTDNEPLTPSRAEQDNRSAQVEPAALNPASTAYSLEGASRRMGNEASNQALAAGRRSQRTSGMTPASAPLSPTAALSFFAPQNVDPNVWRNLPASNWWNRRSGPTPSGPGGFLAGGRR